MKVWWGESTVWENKQIFGYWWRILFLSPSKENPVTNTNYLFCLSNYYEVEIWYITIHCAIVSKITELIFFDEYESVIEKKLDGNGHRIELP